MGDLLYEIDATGGLAIYSAVPPGGQIPLQQLYGGGVYGATMDQIVSGSTLYTAQQSDGPLVTIYDLNSSPPAVLGSYNETGESPLSLAISQNFLFVGARENLFVLDVSTPSSPTKVASLALSTSSLAIVGNSLFVGTTDNRLVVVDITNPKAPVQKGQVSLPDIPNTIRSAGNLLYVADNSAGLLIYAVSNLSPPALLSQYKLSTVVADTAVNGNLAFLAAAESGLVILDVTNPAAPVTLSQVPLDVLSCFAGCQNPAATSVAVYGGLLYLGSVGAGAGSVFGFDYKVPSHPRLVSLQPFGGELDEAVFNFAFYKTNMFVGTDLFAVVSQADITQPRNVINLYYPDFTNGSGSFTSAARGSGSYSSFKTGPGRARRRIPRTARIRSNNAHPNQPQSFNPR